MLSLCGRAPHQGAEFAAAAIEEAHGGAALPAGKVGEGSGEFAPHRHRLFRRRRRGWRAQIGGMIDQGPIRLVPDRRDERHKASRRRAHDDFLVETPQIFERTTAPRDNNHIRPPQRTVLRQGIEAVDRGGDLGRRGFALDPHRPDHDMARKPFRDAVQDVADDGAGRRRHDAYAARAERAMAACALRRKALPPRVSGGAPR